MSLRQPNIGLPKINIANLFAILALMAGSAFAQNIQHTQNTADASLRGNLQVDPSTLGMSLQIPLGEYSGRNGLNIPVSLSYGSKQWRMELAQGFQGTTAYHTQSEARYAEHSTSGWTGSLDIPSIEYLGDSQPFDYLSGDATCVVCDPVPDYSTLRYVERLLVHLPDGSSHECRKSDIPVVGGDVGMGGIYLAVDGSRIKFDADNGIIYLPDGSRYLLVPPTGDVQFVDRNGNALTYNLTLKQWTDTMGRAIPAPPLNNSTATDRTYALPSFGSATRSIILRWRTLSTVRTDPSQPLRYKGNKNCPGYPETTVSPSLFTSTPVLDSVCWGGPLFNPIVLWQIELPNQTTYTFTYNVYGEVDKVVLPTGGYERFRYAAVDGLSTEAIGNAPFGQANRGVVEHWISAKGDGTDEVRWQYSALRNTSANVFTTTVIGPNNAKSERVLHMGGNSRFGFEDARAGRAYEERTYAAGGQMIRRTLVEWAMTSTVLPPPYQITTAMRDPRGTKKVEILLDTGGNALAATTVNSYDNDLNEIGSTKYDYVSVNPTTAQTGDINSFALGAALRTEEAAYLVNDTSIAQTTRDAYRARHLIALPTSTRVKNGATVAAETQFKYDEAAYPILTYPGVTPPGWNDPATTLRGNVTTVRRWLNVSGSTVQSYPSGSYLETHAQYDQFGNLRFATDARGKVAETQYNDAFSDAINRNTFAYATKSITPQPDPTGVYGSSTAFNATSVYDYKSGKVVSTTDANAQVTNYSYGIAGGPTIDAFIRLGKVTLPGSLGETIYSYGDLPGNLYISTQTKQNATTWIQDDVYFDNIGRAKRAGHKESATQWSVKDTEYDSLGRVQRVNNPYFAANLSGATPANSEWTTSTYDDLNRALTVTTPDGAVVTTAYSGNQVTVTDPAQKNRRSISDALGRLTQVLEAPNAPNALNYQTNYTYDVLGNLITVQQGTQYRYFFYDSLTRLVRAKNPEQTANAGLNLSNPPAYNNNWSLSYSYDGNGNVLTRADARNAVASYGYDALNRNITVSYTGVATPSVERHYDWAVLGKGRFHYNYSGGNFSTGTTVEHTAIDSYDALGRALTSRQLFKTSNVWGQTFSSSRAYDLAGHITSQTYPSGRTVNYSYGASGRLASANGNLGGTNYTYADTIGYTPAGLLARERFGTTTNLYHNLIYNNRLQLVDIRLGDSATDNLTWTRGALVYYYGTNARNLGNVLANSPDNNGNPLRQINYVPLAGGGYVIPQLDDYDYDSLNRVTSIAEAQQNSGGTWTYNVSSQTFTYDRWGNRLSVVGQTPQNWDATEAAATNRLRYPGTTGCPASGTRVCYDATGNLIFDNTLGSTGDRTYDAENRMVTAAGGGANSYVYDADGRRVRRVVGAQTFFQVYGAGGELVGEYLWNGSTATLQKEYGYRGGEMLIVAEGATVRWLVTDHLGTPRILADQTGSLAGIKRHDYLPFGEENFLGAQRVGNGYQADNVRQKFTGYERDAETNLDYAQARYYGNLLGRFTSVDPLDGSASLFEPQSWNRYSYVSNRPTIATDPSGLIAKYYIDGIEASASDVRALIGAGWAVIAPVEILRYNTELFNGQGGYEHFRATADGQAGWGYFSKVTTSAIDEETGGVLESSTNVDWHWTRQLGSIIEWQGQLAFNSGGTIRNGTGGIIGEQPIEMHMLGPLDYVGVGELKAGAAIAGIALGSLKTIGAKALLNVTSKPRTIEAALELGAKWLGPGYKEIGKAGSGVFRSADGLRQFRMTAADIVGQHGKIGSHVHFEKLNSLGEIIKNIHTPIQ